LTAPLGTTSTQPQCSDASPPGDQSKAPSVKVPGEANTASIHFAECLDHMDHELLNLLGIGEQLAQQATEQLATLVEHAAHVDWIKQRLCSCNFLSDNFELNAEGDLDTQQLIEQITRSVTASKAILLQDAQPAFQNVGKTLSKNASLLEQLRAPLHQSHANVFNSI